MDFGLAGAVTFEVTGRRGRRVAAPPRDSQLAPASPAQGSSVLLARSRTLPRKTMALDRFVHKISRSGAAALTLRVNFVPDAFGVLRRAQRSPKPSEQGSEYVLEPLHVVGVVGEHKVFLVLVPPHHILSNGRSWCTSFVAHYP